MRKVLPLFILPTLILTSCGNFDDQIQREKDQFQSSQYDLSIQNAKEDFFSPIGNDPNLVLKTDPKVNLGYHLYYDPRLSKNSTISCNSCHDLNAFGVDNEATSLGDDGITRGGRNSPTVLNASMHFKQFWDGRAETIEDQAGMPITNPVEMMIPNEDFLVQRLKDIDLYKKLFKRAYPSDDQPITYSNLTNAIGAFERKLITPAPFDAYLKGDLNALTLQEKKGMMSFIKVGCTQCHTGPLLGATMFQKFGIHHDYWTLTNSPNIDNGLFDLNQDENQKYMFKVPSLRNIEHTAPYFHDGHVKELKDAVIIMAKGQLNYNISDEEAENITAFLKSLSGDLPESVKVVPEIFAQKK
ncbi:MAG TPA: cytochrome c peroxidase [Chitinophagales bacterium]|nr:cytochrome c peroxidase [Chitinophagales bacterium]